ncbi:MAG: succinylglutamate desuccinylase/aspartoacylase family protein [Pseudomonadota bacterium]
MPLRSLTEMPRGLLDCPAQALHEFLGGPTLLRLEGERSPALFVSVLLHGNETSGWDGLRRYLSDRGGDLPRALTIFIGNTAAAAEDMRALPGQPDFNRIWRDAQGEGGALAAALQAAIADEAFVAAVDLHNNTGHNPFYSVVTDLEAHNLGLAYLFSDKAVFVEEPDTVLTRTFEGRCPAVALEVGPVADPRCVDRVIDYLARLMDLESIPEAKPELFSLFRTRVRVHVKDGVNFHFEGEGPSDDFPLVLTGGVEAVNFHELGRGTVFGSSALAVDDVLQVLDTDHRDVTSSYFEHDGRDILLKESVVPAMYTTDSYVVRQDCLCYFMERLAF